MGLGQQIHGGLHDASGTDHGGLVRRPRLYEATTVIGFGGRRRRIYNDLISASGVTTGDRVLDVGCDRDTWFGGYRWWSGRPDTSTAPIRRRK